MLISIFDTKIKREMEKKKINHQNNLNPFYGHRHSIESKQKMSDSQKARYQQYRNALDNIHHVTMDEFLNNESFHHQLKEIIREEIKNIL